MDLTEAAAAWRRDGFVVLPGYLAGPELAAAQRDLAVVYPTAEEYHAAPAEGRNRAYTGDEFGGVIPFPFWLSDVPEDHGPTHLVPLPVTAGAPALPHGYLRPQRPEFYERERSGSGPDGTVVAYSTDTFHRGTEITAPHSARFSAHASYKHADNQWAGRHSWGDRSFHPDWNPFAEQATARQLELFGFPPPGHPYWTPQTLRDLAVRYPGLDTSPWQPGEA